MKIFKHEKQYEKTITILLFTILLLILSKSILPIQPANSWSDFASALLQEGKGGKMTLLDLIPDAATVLERLFSFVPLGFLIYQKMLRRSPQHPRAISIGLIVLITLGIEILQAAISMRHSRILDFILAMAAGIIGIKFGHSISPTSTYSFRKKIQKLLPGCLWLGNYLVICICLAAIMSSNTDIREWNCEYPILIGNELTFDRPWQGEIRGMGIYPKELDTNDIRKLSNLSMTPDNSPIRQQIGAIALYSFEINSNARTLIHRHIGPILNLTREKLGFENTSTGTGNNTTSIQSKSFLIKNTAPARTICEAILASQAFTIETEIASDNPLQSGPARIVSISTDLENRNFTLGEEYGDLVLRVRTLQNGSNGNNLPLKTQHGALAQGWKHVIASYSNSTAKISIDGKEAVQPLHYKEALLFGTAMSVETALATVLLLIGMGVMASILFQQQSTITSVVKCVCFTSLIPIVSVYTAAIILGFPVNPIFTSAIVLTPLLGFVFFRQLQR